MSDMSAPATDRNGLEVLPLQECLELAASVPIARVAVNASGSPVVMPVTHSLVGSAIAFRSASGSKLDAAIMNRPVTVEMDDWDGGTRTGWSVLFIGIASPADDPELIATLDAQAPPAWVHERDMEWVIVRADEISGRRILPPPD